MKALKAIRIVVWAAVVFLGGAIIWSVVTDKMPSSVAIIWFGGNDGDKSGGGIAAASIGGPFKLVDQKGATVTEAALQGHPSALFFGYTFCPDVCPTTLADMTIWLKDLGAGGDKLKAYFITVDPERDTQEAMAAYLDAFDPRITGLTGTRPAIDQIIKAYRVYSRKVDGTDGAPYVMDHPVAVYLLDDKAQFVGTVDYQEKPEDALAKLKRLVGA
jgi:protein SCO1/2